MSNSSHVHLCLFVFQVHFLSPHRSGNSLRNPFALKHSDSFEGRTAQCHIIFCPSSKVTTVNKRRRCCRLVSLLFLPLQPVLWILLMDCVEQKDTEAKAPSVVDRYYTRWYRAGKGHVTECCLMLAARWLIQLTLVKLQTSAKEDKMAF